MNATAVRFISLGICGIVKDLGLSELGRHVAQRMKDMTTKQDVDTGGKPYSLDILYVLTQLRNRTGRSG